MEGLGKITAVLVLAGVGVALSIPKVRKRIKENINQIGEKTREGYLAAVQKVSKGKEAIIEKTIQKTKKSKLKKISEIKTKIKKPLPKTAPAVAESPVSIFPETEEVIIKTLKDNPSGKSLTDLGSALNTHFIKLASPIKRLIEQGKVKKEGKLYLAVA